MARTTAAASYYDDCAQDFGHVAGIPTCSKCSPVGARLRHTLRNRPHEFVALALEEVREIIARPERQQPAAAMSQVDRIKDHEPAEPRTSHYASIREQLEHSLGGSSISDTECGRQGGAVEGILRGHSKFSELADVIYFWSLGEAYSQHPQMQADMRQALGRGGSVSPAAGADSLELQSRVQLLDGPFFEGQYMIGSVNFVSTASSSQSEENSSSTSSSGLQWGAAPGDVQDSLPLPSLDGVLGSDNGRMLMALEGDSPARMMRQGAARCYHMYLQWGYFQRRMSVHRSSSNGDESSTGEQLSLGIGVEQPASQPLSSYGAVSKPWRFFENVPDELSNMRTKEAASVADRHLRALFGDQEECITTLQAWQQMTYEAKWFGRSLFDAEEVVIRSCITMS